MIQSPPSLEVPLLDLTAQTRGIRAELLAALSQVVDESNFILGRQVEELEKKVGSYSQCAHAAGVASGTDALLLSLKAAGVGAGDEVITTPYTFFATAGAIHNAGARPVFVDIEPETFNLRASAVAESITSRTRAVIAVDLFGQCADLETVARICEAHRVHLIEDAAQSIGARVIYRGESRVAGSVGLCGCLSFFPSKNLGGIGDGGMVVSNDEDLVQRIKKLRVHGSAHKYYHDVVGFNSRLDTINAAVLLVKLPYLEQWIGRRRENAENYSRLFSSAGLERIVSLPAEKPGYFHTYNQFVIGCPNRDRLQRFLKESGIASAVYYPVPLHLQKCFRYLGYSEGGFPVAERLAKTSLALPIYPELSSEQQEHVVSCIKRFYEKDGGTAGVEAG